MNQAEMFVAPQGEEGTFKAMFGRGWAFMRNVVGPKDDQRTILTGDLPIDNGLTLFVEIIAQGQDKPAHVKIKNRANWQIVAEFDVPPAVRGARTAKFKIGERALRLIMIAGQARTGMPCIHLRLPQLMPSRVAHVF